MKYYLINNIQQPQTKQQFFQANSHLKEKVIPVDLPAIRDTLRLELQKQDWITKNNKYDLFNLALAKTHLELWQAAAQHKNNLTVFQTNTIVHPDFFTHQVNVIHQYPDYDLIIWGYNLDWHLCIQLHPAFPRTFYTFPGHENKNLAIPNNQSIDIKTYYNNSINLQTARIFSFAELSCYSISSKGAKILLEKCLPIGNTPSLSQQSKLHGTNFYVLQPSKDRPNITFDIEINRHLEDINAYITIPPLAIIL